MSDGAETGALFPEEAGQEPVMTKGQTHAVGILPAHGIQNMVRDALIIKSTYRKARCWRRAACI